MVSSEDSAWDVPPSIFGTRSGGPTVQRLVLGSQLHRLRESRGITAEQAAEADAGQHEKRGQRRACLGDTNLHETPLL